MSLKIVFSKYVFKNFRTAILKHSWPHPINKLNLRKNVYVLELRWDGGNVNLKIIEISPLLSGDSNLPTSISTSRQMEASRWIKKIEYWHLYLLIIGGTRSPTMLNLPHEKNIIPIGTCIPFDKVSHEYPNWKMGQSKALVRALPHITINNKRAWQTF